MMWSKLVSKDGSFCLVSSVEQNSSDILATVLLELFQSSLPTAAECKGYRSYSQFAQHGCFFFVLSQKMPINYSEVFLLFFSTPWIVLSWLAFSSCNDDLCEKKMCLYLEYMYCDSLRLSFIAMPWLAGRHRFITYQAFDFLITTALIV